MRGTSSTVSPLKRLPPLKLSCAKSIPAESQKKVHLHNAPHKGMSPLSLGADIPPDAAHTQTPPREKDYVIVNGLRHVAPYVHSFTIKVAKSREGGSLLDALDAHCKFQGSTASTSGREFWQTELTSGRVKIVHDLLKRLPHNSLGSEVPCDWWSIPTGLDHIIQPDTRLLVTKHVHEQVVSATTPKTIFEDDILVIVDKPAGVPSIAGVGPGLPGENNCAAIINRNREDNAHELFAVNRIDKPVSGLWMLAKGSKLSAKVRNNLSKPGAEKRKTYLALVKGRVKQEGFTANQALRVGTDSRAEVQGVGVGDVADEDTGDEKNPYKSATTKVVPICFVTNDDGSTDTLVHASLIQSGRFHQIRAHCAFHGHCIVGDYSYDSTIDGSNQTGFGGVDQTIDDANGALRDMHETLRVPWCHTCDELCVEVGEVNEVSKDTLQTYSKLAGAYICLHAFEYEFKHNSRLYSVRSNTVPDFVTSALLHNGWRLEECTPELIAKEWDRCDGVSSA